jgi:beta-lactamase class C
MHCPGKATLSVGVFCLISAALLSLQANAQPAGGESQRQLDRLVKETIQPIMKEHDIPGLAVAVTSEGRQYFFNFGVASRESGRKVSEKTIFEIGSVSKTLTGTLGAYAQTAGFLSLSDKASMHLPALAGSSFDGISLLDLATYTPGGLPLQFPDEVTDPDTMVAYFRTWRPAYVPGTHRVYSNPSIGLFGHLAARSMGAPFHEIMQGKLFPILGLQHTFITVPRERMSDYAFGYSKEGKPIRVNPGVLDAEAYGVKTTSADLIRFVEANIDGARLDDTLRQAIAATHAGYHRIGVMMMQGLGWEMYPYSADLEQLLAGNSTEISMKPNKTTKLEPPMRPDGTMLLNKTGSTNGFGAYVAFVPAKRIGVVLLANKYYPNALRVRAAHRILAELAEPPGPAPSR